jgi:hypothetical protein
LDDLRINRGAGALRQAADHRPAQPTKEFAMQSALTRIGAFGLIILIGFSLTAFGQAAWGIATLSA